MVPAERYEAKVDRSAGPHACHYWTACKSTDGYGHFKAEGRTLQAHRFGYELLVGSIPDSLQVRHTCDNPPCQNPLHWLLGTNADNVRDKVNRERQQCQRGERNPSVKLTAEQVAEIRQDFGRSGVTQSVIAASYGISQSQVSKIVHGVKWADA